MKSLLLLPLLCLLSAATAWRFVSKVEELPVDATDRLEILRPKVRLCGGDSGEESTDCVLCTVCHPHEYELIGCSGQMDSVCASCTTGWMKTTPKTVDFFRKCKKHPQLNLFFPDVPYGYRTKRVEDKSSMFIDQEEVLQQAELNESAEMIDDVLSEEDYDGEDEDDEEEGGNVDDAKDAGVDPVNVDERDEDSASNEVDTPVVSVKWDMYGMHADLEAMIAAKFKRLGMERTDEDEMNDNVSDDIATNESLEDEDSMEVMELPVDKKEEERADPFDEKTEMKEESEEEPASKEASKEEESEELEHRVYPLHKVNIWKIIGPEKMKIDDEGISDEVRDAINDRMDEWRAPKGLEKQRIQLSNVEVIGRPRGTFGSYSNPIPMPLPRPYVATMTPLEYLGWAFVFLLTACMFICGCKLFNRIVRRNRIIVLPELDDMSRQLINEAHARVHAKKEKKNAWPKPEFV